MLFIDEIGEMDPYLQSKLLKVLEDKKFFWIQLITTLGIPNTQVYSQVV